MTSDRAFICSSAQILTTSKKEKYKFSACLVFAAKDKTTRPASLLTRNRTGLPLFVCNFKVICRKKKIKIVYKIDKINNSSALINS